MQHHKTVGHLEKNCVVRSYLYKYPFSNVKEVSISSTGSISITTLFTKYWGALEHVLEMGGVVSAEDNTVYLVAYRFA